MRCNAFHPRFNILSNPFLLGVSAGTWLSKPSRVRVARWGASGLMPEGSALTLSEEGVVEVGTGRAQASGVLGRLCPGAGRSSPGPAKQRIGYRSVDTGLQQKAAVLVRILDAMQQILSRPAGQGGQRKAQAEFGLVCKAGKLITTKLVAPVILRRRTHGSP